MTYVAPSTVVAGQTYGAAAHNVIVNDVIDHETRILSARNAQINVQQAIKTDTQVFSSATGVDWTANVTGLSVTITPSSASSKILLIANLSLMSEGVGNIAFRLLRSTTPIGVGDTAGSRARVTNSMAGNIALLAYSIGGMILDSPATTSATTYNVQLYNLSSIARNLFVNRGFTDTDANTNARSVSTLMAIEVPV